MSIRRVRLVLAVVGIWLFASWYFSGRPNYPLPFPGSGGQSDYSEIGSDIQRWEKLPTRYPVKNLAILPTDKSNVGIPRVQASPKPREDAEAKEIRLKRLAAVKESFIHSWEGYKMAGWLHDEVRPVSGTFKDPFGGWAATLVDTLDTLWIIGLKDDFELAVKACEEIDFTTTATQLINVFETTIRYLGGFLAAYELSERQYPSLLRKAVEVADLIMCAFDTPNHAPITRWDWRAYTAGVAQIASRSTLVSEIGSLSLELSKLSQLTGDMQYHDAAQRISDQFEKGQRETYLPGMWPVIVDPSKSPMEFPGNSFTLGGMSDSLYEYFPKQYLLLGGQLAQPRKLYEGFIDVGKKHLLFRALNPDNKPLMFFGDADVRNGKVETTARGQHLTCFAGGMLGMAAKIFDRPSELKIAQQLTDGCVWTYNHTQSGIGPEIFHFVPCDPDPEEDDCQWSQERWFQGLGKYWGNRMKDKKEPSKDEIEKIIEVHNLPLGMVDVPDRRYILRPEAIESVFMMYRLTGDPEWMDKAWDMFTAIEKLTRTKIAAASLDDVTKAQPAQVDSMESFWLAETLKYFYLIFSDFDVISLDQWVLNTEAHPLRRADA
ncbi:hypothetical protein DL766_010553 [Monosporascus sp. MC13-8B]|nr:hypothetical protein DL763_001066 [Monosporascus cannonballus]RYP02060.1 hypothetical protein DL766_010553 [Monosporascus sp. MC13-8B]